MALSSPVARTAAGALFCLVLLLPSVSAQDPTVPTEQDLMGNAFGFAVIVPNGYVEIDYMGNVVVPVFIQDLSRDSGSAREVPGGGSQTSPSIHTISLSVKEIRPADIVGWQVNVGQPVVYTTGGETVETSVAIKAPPDINVAEISVDIEAVFTASGGYTENQTVTIGAKVKPYSFGFMQVINVAEKAGQFEQVRYLVAITNDAVYPDSFQITAKSDKSEFQVITPPNLYVPAKSTRYTNITVLTPKGNPYELGLTTAITVQAQSLNGGGALNAVGILKVEGAYISTPWIPAILVGLVSAGLLARERRHNAELRRLEKGLPRRVQPTPRQTVLLSELKRRDPEAYDARRAQLAGLYAERRQEYKGTRKERLARDRAEHKQARLELREAKKLKKAAALAAAKEAKVEKKAAKRQAKLDKKEAKAQAKVDKKEAKVLAKKRKVLEKQKAKLEKQHAKASAKEAKAQAKAEKAAAREAKKAAKRSK